MGEKQGPSKQSKEGISVGWLVSKGIRGKKENMTELGQSYLKSAISHGWNSTHRKKTQDEKGREDKSRPYMFAIGQRIKGHHQRANIERGEDTWGKGKSKKEKKKKVLGLGGKNKPKKQGLGGVGRVLGIVALADIGVMGGSSRNTCLP